VQVLLLPLPLPLLLLPLLLLLLRLSSLLIGRALRSATSLIKNYVLVFVRLSLHLSDQFCLGEWSMNVLVLCTSFHGDRTSMNFRLLYFLLSLILASAECHGCNVLRMDVVAVMVTIYTSWMLTSWGGC
jgi:hypothetical protein